MTIIYNVTPCQGVCVRCQQLPTGEPTHRTKRTVNDAHPKDHPGLGGGVRELHDVHFPAVIDLSFGLVLRSTGETLTPEGAPELSWTMLEA